MFFSCIHIEALMIFLFHDLIVCAKIPYSIRIPLLTSQAKSGATCQVIISVFCRCKGIQWDLFDFEGKFMLITFLIMQERLETFYL